MSSSDDSLSASQEKRRAAEKKWREEVLDPALEAKPERQDPFLSQQMQWPVKDLYTPDDLDEAGFDYLKDSGYPGQFPFTRGTEPSGYRQDL